MGGLVLVLAVIAATDPPLARSAGIDVWNLTTLGNELEANAARQQDLAVRDDAIWHRMIIKEQLIADLIEGHTSLADTTGHFMMLHRADADARATIRANYPGRTETESTAQNVIGYVVLRLQESNPLHDAVRERVTCELHEITSAD